ncbi:MAG: hypothetical protein AMXMBFR84_14100 [Candidatus Hydrogenedentota bacterium]
MNRNQMAGTWTHFKGELKERWGKLTDDDLKIIEGKREKLAGRLQERYGFPKEQAENEARAFYESHH